MSVVLSNEEVGPSRRALKVEVPATEVEAETRQVLAALRQRVQVPGFRKGKAPTEVLRRRYGDEIEQQLLDRLVPRYWHRAREESGIRPLRAPEVSAVELEAGAPLTFVATVDVRPEIELRNIRDFDLPEIESEPTADEVSAAIDDLRRARGTWNTVERPAVRGDLIEGRMTELAADGSPLSVEGEGDGGGEADEGAQGRPVRFEIGHPKVWEELTLAATGSEAGREVELTRREEQGETAGSERRFRLHVDAVKEQELPPLDDEFARQLAGFDDVAALERDLTAQIRRAKGEEARRRREQALLDQLRERHPLTLPEGVVEHEIRQLLGEYAEDLARQGVDVEHAGIDWNHLAGEARPQAERRVHSRLLLDAVAEAEGVEVPADELSATLAAIARAQKRSAAALRRELAEAGKLDALVAQLRRERAVRHLLGELEPAADAEAGEAE